MNARRRTKFVGFGPQSICHQASNMGGWHQRKALPSFFFWREKLSFVSGLSHVAFEDESARIWSGLVPAPDDGPLDPAISGTFTATLDVHESQGLLGDATRTDHAPVFSSPLASTTAVPVTSQDPVISYSHEADNYSDRPATWIPYTLRRPFLLALAAVALSLSTVLAVLCWYSSRNHGLGKDDGSSGLLMGWRYTPTLIAVLFTQALVLLFDDVQRTEPFAQLSRVRSNEASDDEKEQALQLVSKVWWKTFFLGLSKKKNGGRINTLLSMSALTTGLGVLLFSTLSSSLLVSEQVIIVNPVDLRRYALDSDGSLALDARRETYFHTTSGFNYNASTTMWVTDDFVIFPFQVPGLESDNETMSEGLWEAETTVYQSEGSCMTMSVESLGTVNLTYTYEWDNRTFTKYSAKPDNVSYSINDTSTGSTPGLALVAENGCRIQIVELPRSPRTILQGGPLWTNLSASHVTWEEFSQEQGGIPWVSYDGWSPMRESPLVEFSEACYGQELLFVSEPWRTTNFDPVKGYEYWGPDFEARAELCNVTHYEATMLVSAAVNANSMQATFDQEEFKVRRKPLREGVLNLENAANLAFSGTRPEYKSLSSVYNHYQISSGLIEALAVPSQSNNTIMIHDDSLVAKATRLRGRFFGELVYSSLTTRENPNMENITGQSTRTEQRVVVIVGIGAALAAMFFCVACYLIFMIWKASPKSRALSLRTDPTTAAGMVDYIHHEGSHIVDAFAVTETRRLNAHDDAKAASGWQIWSKRPWNKTSTKGGTITTTTEVHVDASSTGSTESLQGAPHETSQDWRPTMLLSRTLVGFLIILIAITTALIVLHKVSVKGGLYRSSFVYHMSVGKLNAQISPISVTSTLLAVALALCWDSIDRSLRILQPYLSMSKGPTDVREGACLSYQSSYWLWASSRAAFNKHWLLSLVTLGTTLFQILIVAMAAVFERQPSTYTQTVMIDRPLTPRRQPLVYQHQAGTADDEYLWPLMKTTTGDWLYTALDDLTLGTTSPPWTRDEWSFTPINLDKLPALRFHQTTGRKQDDSPGTELLSSPSNVTITTTAIRAELKCQSIVLANKTLLSKDETETLKNEIQKLTKEPPQGVNMDGYVLPRAILNRTNYHTTLANTPLRVACCANNTGQDRDSAVAYWSHQQPDLWWEEIDFSLPSWTGFGPPKWPGNLMLKWIVGQAETTEFNIYTNGVPSNYTVMYFPTMPETQIMSCEPSIESAEATVTVARSSGQVLDYEILQEPQRILDPWDAAYQYSGLGEDQDAYDVQSNYTVSLSYGVYFLTQLIQAASLNLNNNDPLKFENFQDERYNIRDRQLGLNMDFMSYSNYVQVNRDNRALLDSDTMFNVSRRTFQTFFQHYASRTRWIDGNLIAYDQVEPNGDFQMPVVMSQRIEVLALSEIATWLCVAILVVIIAVLFVLIISLKFLYPHTLLRRNVRCLADAISMVYESEHFVEQVVRQGPEQLAKSGLKTKLAWFRNRNGKVTWGIEVVDDGVEWIGKSETVVVLSEKPSPAKTTPGGSDGAGFMERSDGIRRVV
ncbi:hypothetical protein LEMA_P098790.1 [Plenodomus lingam JN3]|uniref:Uncharacterized protein n=1 Tax=Leptosphaeria maculans (strain JN3 / isolate v23.1.3 / race Av1-4-5-6-7-8) TaxID=985895 RepID=E5A4C5_LEPMJ|nr:hypothetical protein LEMA_P098790.1 [Plenodomus lingam JN3]CBX98470.1 hypothetical protein LEMA_P098790.1 [Plenodomus lingam JN3]